jgi:thiol-disulfide isomerase/thioredoxin
LTKAILSAVAICAALAGVAGAAPTRPARQTAHGAQTQATPQPASKPQGAVPKPQAGAAQTKGIAVTRPRVSEINDAELKSLLGAGSGRARPLLVNFWATWCAPCREEFPDLVKIRGQYGADKLDFVLVSLDDPVDIDKAVPEFLAEVRATAFPSYLLHADDDNAAINLVDPTWSGELPATFLYDRAGNVVFKHKGRVRAAELRAALDEALKEKPQQAGAQR